MSSETSSSEYLTICARGVRVLLPPDVAGSASLVTPLAPLDVGELEVLPVMDRPGQDRPGQDRPGPGRRVPGRGGPGRGGARGVAPELPGGDVGEGVVVATRPRPRRSGARRGSAPRRTPPGAARRRTSARPSSMKSAIRPAFSRDWLRPPCGADDLDVAPELLALGPGAGPAPCSRPSSAALHAAVVPHEVAELAVERVRGAGGRSRRAAGRCGTGPSPPPRRRSRGASASTFVERDRRPGSREIVVRQHEVAVGETLHQRAGAEPVGAVVGEVGLTGDEQARDVGAQVVVDPQSAHRVVDRRVDAHRHLVGVLAGDPLVHVEEVPVPGLDLRCARAARWRRRSRGTRPARIGTDAAPGVADRSSPAREAMSRGTRFPNAGYWRSR